MPARSAPRRHVRRRADQHHRRPRRAAHGAARAARRRRRSRRCARRARAHAGLRRASARQRHPPCRQHRHRRQRSRPADGGAGARRLRSSRAAIPLRLQRRRPRHRSGAAPPEPDQTLFIIASKTFTTQETMANAQAARRLVHRPRRHRHRAALRRHAPPTSKPPPSSASTRTFGFWDWVGGRYSLWSAIGLPIALAIGADNFRALLAGAHAMDRHFATAPLEHEPAGAARPARRLVPQLPRLHEPQRRALPPGPEAAAGVPAAARDGKQRQVRRPRRPAAALRHQPGGLGRAGHQRPACVLSDAASGYRCDSGGVHRRQAAGARRMPICSASCWPTAWRSRRR